MSIAFSLLLFLEAISRWICAQNVEEQHMVAFRCHWPAMHLTDEGWTSDNMTDCLSNPSDILNYCKKIYQTSDVRNIVEFDRTVTVRNWCDFGGKKCIDAIDVLPYQCLVGSFVASELVVPDEKCFSDRIIDSRTCKSLGEWRSASVGACNQRKLRIEKLSVLDPCDIGQFSGIQFICCPFNEDSVELINSRPAVIEVKSTAASVATGTAADGEPENEHRRYLRVKTELHKQHDDEISKIMNAWVEAQQEVSKMRRKDPEMADRLERKMTARFQKTIRTLEEREEAERHQIDSNHERNVELELNKKKRKAMEAYMEILSHHPLASMKNIFQVLRHYVRVEQKDRMHVINRFLHLKETDASAAESIRALVAERLRTIQLRLKRALDMLSRVTEYKLNITRKIQDIIEEYQGFDALEASIVNVSVSEDHSEVVKSHSGNAEQTDNEGKKNNDGNQKFKDPNDSNAVSRREKQTRGDFKDIKDDEVSDFEKSSHEASDTDEAVKMNPVVLPSHLGASELHLAEEKSFKLNRKVGSSVGPVVLVVMTSVFLVTVTILGIVVWRRYVETRRIQSQLREDSRLLVSPEQAHIAKMQASGYENPTYKYFETKTTD